MTFWNILWSLDLLGNIIEKKYWHFNFNTCIIHVLSKFHHTGKTYLCVNNLCLIYIWFCRRGKPLFLSQERYNLLKQQWLSHSFDHSCKRWIWHLDRLWVCIYICILGYKVCSIPVIIFFERISSLCLLLFVIKMKYQLWLKLHICCANKWPYSFLYG